MRYIVSLLLLCALGPAAAASDAAVRERGRALATTWLRGDIAPLWTQMAPAMRGFLRSEAAFANVSARMRADLGSETAVLDEVVRQDEGYAVYRRTARWSKAGKTYVMEWAISTEDKIVGFAIDEPRAPSPALTP